MEILEIISKEHKRWVRMAFYMCHDMDMSNEFVQEMYLRVDKYVKDKSKIVNKSGSINVYYIYVIIRNIYYKWFNSKDKYEIFEYKEFDDMNALYEEYLDESVQDVMDRYEMEESYDKLMNSIYHEIDSWHWYDQKLSKLYLNTDMTMRDLAEETKISLTSIYNSIKNYKSNIRDKFGEDVEDFNNQDYDKI